MVSKPAAMQRLGMFSNSKSLILLPGLDIDIDSYALLWTINITRNVKPDSIVMLYDASSGK